MVQRHFVHRFGGQGARLGDGGLLHGSRFGGGAQARLADGLGAGGLGRGFLRLKQEAGRLRRSLLGDGLRACGLCRAQVLAGQAGVAAGLLAKNDGRRAMPSAITTIRLK